MSVGPSETIRPTMARMTEIPAGKQAGGKERRVGRRTKLARNLLIRPYDPRYSEEVQPSANLSRGGLYFVTSSQHYYIGMRLELISGYVPNDPCNTKSFGEIVRIDKLGDGQLGIAVRILLS